MAKYLLMIYLGASANLTNGVTAMLIKAQEITSQKSVIKNTCIVQSFIVHHTCIDITHALSKSSYTDVHTIMNHMHTCIISSHSVCVCVCEFYIR